MSASRSDAKTRLRVPVVRPFVTICPMSQNALDAMGFAIKRVLLERDTHGWLLLTVDWDATTDAYRVKYPADGGSGWSGGGGGESEHIELTFPQVPAPYWSPLYGGSPFECADHAARHTATLEVGIAIRTGRALKSARLGWRYAYHDNTKYGVTVYFQPRGWYDDLRMETMYQWTKRRTPS